MDSEAAQTIKLTLASIQLDNQLQDAIFPVTLQPTPLPKNDCAALTNLPAVQARAQCKIPAEFLTRL